MNEWYFAYGSNLWIDQMAARTGPIAQGDDRPRVARLPDHRLVFNMQGEDGQVFATVERPGEGVLGVIYRCDQAALDKLDAYEWGYERYRVLVTDQGGATLGVVTYVAKADRVACGGKPSAEYLERVVRGARQHCLPEAYIREIENAAQKEKTPLNLNEKNALAFAQLALKGLQREYPNKPAQVLNNDADAKSPKSLHPAFYGCFDWHSSVHSHWMLVRLLRLFPKLPEKDRTRAVLGEHLTAKNLQIEADYFVQPNHKSFERTYGWAWLLKLDEELRSWDDPDAKEWSQNLKPLTDALVASYLSFLPKQTYPIRTGVHPNTAFGLTFALDYARKIDHKALRELIEERSRTYFANDAGIPAKWEPDGGDFFSPSLMEADLMRRVLPPAEFRTWFKAFLPDLVQGDLKSLLTPATVSDRTDPQIVHLDGLNLSRAWCMRSIGAALPADDPVRKILAESAMRHAAAALDHVASGNYGGEHWLASFATYMLSTPAPA